MVASPRNTVSRGSTSAWDVVVIGGGAAGFFGAITCAEALGSDARVVILEKARRVLTKVEISGGGRCNVTHDCLDPDRMARDHYPRGNMALIGPFYHFGVAQTIEWFQSRGVALKTEEDGRLFPVTDDSKTVVDCLRRSADEAGVEVRTGAGVSALVPMARDEGRGFELLLKGGEQMRARQVLVATGGTRLSSSERLGKQAGHTMAPAAPSLFTFLIEDNRISQLQGLSVAPVEIQAQALNLDSRGPLLITHRGISGPAVLKMSAWGARKMMEVNYDFQIAVDWLPGVDIEAMLRQKRQEAGKRRVRTLSPFDAIPKRLWRRLVEAAQIDRECQWATLTSQGRRRLVDQLTASTFDVRGQSTHKEEFVTCGGVPTDEVDMRTMESRICTGLFFAGEVLDIDGVTGGFNFQSAWTTGYLAGRNMAQALMRRDSDQVSGGPGAGESSP